MFKNKHGELRGGWGVLLGFLALQFSTVVANFLLGLALVVYAMRDGQPLRVEAAQNLLETSPGMQMFGSILSVMCSVGATLLLFKLLYKRPLRHMGLAGPRAPGAAKDLLLGCGLGLAAISAAAGVLLLGGGVVEYVNFKALTEPRFWVWLLLFVAVAFNEELFTRGLLMTVMKTTRSKATVLLVPAAVFALMHLGNPAYSWLPALNIFLVGLVFGAFFLRTGQLWLPIGFHFAWNFFQGNFWGLEVSGLATPSLLKTRFTGPAWLTGGAFGAEGGVAVTAVCLVLLAVAWFAWPKRTAPAWSLGSDLPMTRHKKVAKPVEEA
ncbi:MAG: CPBP family intramembrane metalloprotease [Oscillospiraceae bacterium]|jgi:membrane protease YdiL (CAAX protease family)|nr:CPBP family intramembrane metalloprotease [Oscillospiraceae bacterium]